MDTRDLIISGLIGGVISVVLYPIVTFFVKKYFNKWRINVSIENSDDFKSLRVRNSGLSTLQNVIVYVTINNTKEDILSISGVKTFCKEQIIDDRLSWAKNVDGKNQSDININQGESQKLNVINVQLSYVEVASEQGFFNGSNYTRAFLNPGRDYQLDIRITGDNFFVKEKCLHYDHRLKKLQFQ